MSAKPGVADDLFDAGQRANMCRKLYIYNLSMIAVSVYNFFVMALLKIIYKIDFIYDKRDIRNYALKYSSKRTI